MSPPLAQTAMSCEAQAQACSYILAMFSAHPEVRPPGVFGCSFLGGESPAEPFELTCCAG